MFNLITLALHLDLHPPIFHPFPSQKAKWKTIRKHPRLGLMKEGVRVFSWVGFGRSRMPPSQGVDAHQQIIWRSFHSTSGWQGTKNLLVHSLENKEDQINRLISISNFNSGLMMGTKRLFKKEKNMNSWTPTLSSQLASTILDPYNDPTENTLNPPGSCNESRGTQTWPSCLLPIWCFLLLRDQWKAPDHSSGWRIQCANPRQQLPDWRSIATWIRRTVAPA